MRLFEEGRGLPRSPARPRADGRRGALDAAPRTTGCTCAALMTGAPACASVGRRDEPPKRGRLLRRQGRAGDAAGRAACSWTVVPRADPFLHPGRAPRVLVAGEDAGWLGELHPLVAPRGTWAAWSGFELDLRAVLPRADVVPGLRGPRRRFPAIRQDLAFWVPDGPARPTSWSRSVSRARAASSCATCTSSTSTAPRGARTASLGRAPGASARRDRTLSDEEIAPHAQQDRGGGGTDEARGRAPWLTPTVSVLGARRLRRRDRRAAALPATRSSSWRTSPRGPRRASRLDDVHPRTRVPLELEIFDVAHARRSTRRSSRPTRTAPPRRSSPSCAARGRGSWTSPPTSGCATAASTTTGTASTRRPTLFGQGVYGLPELYRDARRGRRPRGQPRLLPDRRAARPRAAGARRRDRRRRSSTPSRASPAPGRGADRDHALHLRRRERLPYKIDGPPAHAGDRAGAGALGSDADRHVHAAPAAARPGRAGLLLRRRLARAGRGRARSSLLRGRATREPFVELRPGPGRA